MAQETIAAEETGDNLDEMLDNVLQDFAQTPAQQSQQPDTLDLQDAITSTLHQLKKPQEHTPDFGMDMEPMMQELQKLAEGQDFDALLEGLMLELASKELLQEPMQDLAQKYPIWLDEHAAEISADERQTYDAQLVVIRKIVLVFDKAGDEMTSEESKVVAGHMQEMQKLGNPPQGLLVELGAEDLFSGPDMLGAGEGGNEQPAECKNM